MKNVDVIRTTFTLQKQRVVPAINKRLRNQVTSSANAAEANLVEPRAHCLNTQNKSNTSPDHTRFWKDEPRLISSKEAALLLNVSVGTLNNWRTSGKGPRFKRVGRRCFYQIADLKQYLEENTYSSTSQYKGGQNHEK
jgi:hypothetical protein